MDWCAKPYIAPNTLHVCDWTELLEALPSNSVDMMLTDMPYAVTACTWDNLIDLDRWWVEVKRVMKTRGAVVCTASQPFTTTLISSNMDWFRYEWIWNKNKATLHMLVSQRPLKLHENIIVFSSGAEMYNPQIEKGTPYTGTKRKNGSDVYGKLGGIRNSNNGTRYPKSIVNISYAQNPKHPTQKPVALFEYLIKTYTQPGELVVDPFVGSGTTAAAAKITGRQFICGDQSAEYIEIARRRVFPEFGKPPKRPKEPKPLGDLPLFANIGD